MPIRALCADWQCCFRDDRAFGPSMTYFDNESPATQEPAGKTSPTAPAVSKLAAKVAHELNNPLDAVLRFVSLAQRQAKAGDYSNLDRYLSDAQFGLQRMAEILRELMDIGRQTHDILARPHPTPLSELVAHALRTCAAQAEQKRVRIISSDTLSGETAPRYDLRISQVISNLLKNAIEATPEGESVHLTISRSTQQLVLTVEDSGPGISAELIPQLFMPFVTTKPKGAGHGLGLAISRELALSLGGTLFLDNRQVPAHGCIATLLLPLP
jgi:signal transduction histidine kinase